MLPNHWFCNWVNESPFSYPAAARSNCKTMCYCWLYEHGIILYLICNWVSFMVTKNAVCVEDHTLLADQAIYEFSERLTPQWSSGQGINYRHFSIPSAYCEAGKSPWNELGNCYFYCARDLSSNYHLNPKSPSSNWWTWWQCASPGTDVNSSQCLEATKNCVSISISTTFTHHGERI